MMRVLSAPIASASAACVRTDEWSSAEDSTLYPHIETPCASSTGSSAAISSRISGASIAARSGRLAFDGMSRY